MSRDPAHLHPALREVWEALRAAALAELGETIILTHTYRSNAEQAALYAQGRTKPGSIVTNAKPGQSAHNTAPPEGSHAFDFAIVRNGRADWSDVPAYIRVAEIARRLGAESGAFWTTFKDYPHVQMPGWHIGRVYGPAFRILRRAVPAAPPAAPSLPVRVVMLLDQAKRWVKFPGAATQYGGLTVTRHPGGDVQVGPLRITVNDDRSLWIRREEAQK